MQTLKRTRIVPRVLRCRGWQRQQVRTMIRHAERARQPLSYVHGADSEALSHETLPHVLYAAAHDFGDRPAVIGRGTKPINLTYQDLLSRSTHLAAGLHSLGVKAGDRVGIYAPNRAEWVETFWAAALGGYTLVSINPAYKAAELEYALGKVGVKALVTAPAHRSSNYIENLRKVVPELFEARDGTTEWRSARLPDLEQVLCLPGCQEDPTYMADLSGSGAMQSYEDVLGAGGSDSAAVQVIDERSHAVQLDGAAGIQFTSGTTGQPKGATLSHHAMINNARFTGRAQGLTHDDKLLCGAPLYHCLGQVLTLLAGACRGSTLLLPSEGFDPGSTNSMMAEYGATAMMGVPTMFIACMEHDGFAALQPKIKETLRTGIMAGSICPVEVLRRVSSQMGANEVTVCYGMTETAPVSFQTARDDPEWARTQTVGRVSPHVEAKIVDVETREIVPRGQVGELLTRGYIVMKGYFGDEERTKEAIEDRWMKTGDLASMDEQGYVRIEGRLKDMVVRGGENIYPIEIENSLYEMPGVLEVQVVGVPDDRLGEELCAWVQLKPGYASKCDDDDPYSLRYNRDSDDQAGEVTESEPMVSADDVRAWCKERLAHYKVPRYVRFVRPHLGEEFPMTVTGKLQKFQMRDASIDELGLQGKGHGADTRVA